MQQVSKEYKDYLKQSFLDTSYHNTVYLGALNQEAQSRAKVIPEDVLEYSDKRIFENRVVKKKVATYEDCYIRVDGTFNFIGDSPSQFHGMTSSPVSKQDESISTFVKFEFNNWIGSIQVKGLTILFGEDAYPTDFCLIDTNGNIFHQAVNNEKRKYVTSEVIEFPRCFVLLATKMCHSYRRFRIDNFKFGIGLSFDTDNIQSLNYKDQVHPVSVECYTADMTVTVDNQEGIYDIENPSSEINFLEQSQKMELYTELQLSDMTVERMKVATLYLADWKATLSDATFTATDIFNLLDETYYGGKYYPNGTSLYLEAERVLKDVGFRMEEYAIDPYLRKIIIHNPIPICKHKEALQMIANAGRCVMKQDRDGRILLKSSFLPDATLSTDNILSYGSLTHIVDGNVKVSYATYEHEFVIPGKHIFQPINMKWEDAGYISNSMSDDDCLLKDNPTIMIVFEASCKFFNVNILFGSNTPSKLTIDTYLQEEIQESLVFDKNISKEFILNREFKECDEMYVIFQKTENHHQRVYVHGLNFGNVTDKYIGFNDVSQGSLEGSKLETVRNIKVIQTIFRMGTLEEKLQDVDVGVDETIVTFNEPVYDVRVVGNAQFKAFSYACILTSTSPSTVVIYGKKFSVSKQPINYKLNDRGIDKVIENALVDNTVLAHDLAEWIIEYMKSDKEYNFSYSHGDPSLDSSDIIHLENRYTSDLQVQICSHELTMGNAVTGKIKGRKVKANGK